MFRHGATVIFLSLALGFFACLPENDSRDDIAGTSVGTGNPGKIKVSFKQNGLPYVFSGRIDIFGSTQIPISGFNPEPLARFKIESTSEILFSADQMKAIPDSAWPRNSVIGDSLFRFNLIITEDSMGAIVSGLALNKKGNEFLSVADDSGITYKSIFEINAPLILMKPLQVWIRPKTLIATRIHFLFIQGTGYFATSDSGKFLFPAMPEKEYLPLYISVPDKGHILTGEDSVLTYKAQHFVSQETVDTLTDFTQFESHPMPDQYKP